MSAISPTASSQSAARSYKLLIADSHGERDVQIWLPDGQVTVTDLSDVLDLSAGSIFIDENRVSRKDTIEQAQLHNGSVVRVEDRTGFRLPNAEHELLELVAGPNTGDQIQLGPGSVLLSRGIEKHHSPSNAAAGPPPPGTVVLDIDSEHEVTVKAGLVPAVLGAALLDRPTDLGSHTLHLGFASYLKQTVRRAADQQTPPEPRRVAVPEFRADQAPPGPPPSAGGTPQAEPFGVFTALSTLPLALLGLVHPALIAMGLLGPLVALGQWWDQRTGLGSPESVSQAAGADAPITEFSHALRSERRAEEQRRRFKHIGPGQLADLIRLESPQILSGHPADPGTLCVPLASGSDHTWLPDLDAPAIDSRLFEALTQQRRLLSVPIQTDLAATALALCGSHEQVNPILRWIVLSCACRLDPTAVKLVLRLGSAGRSSAADWSWTHWLPALRVQQTDLPETTLWLEGAGSPEGTGQSAQLLVRAFQPGYRNPDDPCETRLDLTADGLAEFCSEPRGQSWPDLTPIGVSPEFAAKLARQASRSHLIENLEWPEASAAAIGLADSAEEQLRLWQVPHGLHATLGFDSHGDSVKVELRWPLVLPAHSEELAAALSMSLATQRSPENLTLLLGSEQQAHLDLGDLCHVTSEIDLLANADGERSEAPRSDDTQQEIVVIHALTPTSASQASLDYLCQDRTVSLIILESDEVSFCAAALAGPISLVRRSADGSSYTLRDGGAEPRPFWPILPGISSAELGAERTALLKVLQSRSGEPADHAWFGEKRALLRAATAGQLGHQTISDAPVTEQDQAEQDVAEQEQIAASRGAFDQF